LAITTIDRVHNETSHRLDARLIAELYGAKLKDLAQWTRVSYETLRKKSDSDLAQTQLRMLVNAWELLATIFESEASIRNWLNHPIRRLQGQTPIWLLVTEGADAFEGLAEEIINGAFD